MAKFSDGWYECDKHGAAQIEKEIFDPDNRVVVLSLSCGCESQEPSHTVVEPTVEPRAPRVGDAVKFDGLLWRIVGEAPAGTDGNVIVYTLANITGQTVAHRAEFEWLGIDTLSGMVAEPATRKRKKKGEQDGTLIPIEGGRVSARLTYGPAEKQTYHKHAISTADLINDEVQKLKHTPPAGSSRPLRSNAPTGKEPPLPPDDPETPPIGPIPKRDGEW